MMLRGGGREYSPLFLMAEKLSRQTGHCRTGEGGLMEFMAWQLEHILEELEEVVVEVAVEVAVALVEEEELVGESVRSMVRLSWDPGAWGELTARDRRREDRNSYLIIAIGK